ncbi:hypothetical protein MNV49_000258 [Pseudohyphozyma bogoriensis]|nr:hypothetical protein MNV49_000258 [Pseudohyphozyma bogoriensis]
MDRVKPYFNKIRVGGALSVVAIVFSILAVVVATAWFVRPVRARIVKYYVLWKAEDMGKEQIDGLKSKVKLGDKPDTDELLDKKEELDGASVADKIKAL